MQEETLFSSTSGVELNEVSIVFLICTVLLLWILVLNSPPKTMYNYRYLVLLLTRVLLVSKTRRHTQLTLQRQSTCRIFSCGKYCVR
ncbi:hypothetical protein STEG23_025808, partial [Scotinomys teguina]